MQNNVLQRYCLVQNKHDGQHNFAVNCNGDWHSEWSRTYREFELLRSEQIYPPLNTASHHYPRTCKTTDIDTGQLPPIPHRTILNILPLRVLKQSKPSAVEEKAVVSNSWWCLRVSCPRGSLTARQWWPSVYLSSKRSTQERRKCSLMQMGNKFSISTKSFPLFDADFKTLRLESSRAWA